MQIKLFIVPVGDSGRALQEMNLFLRSNKILEVENQFIGNKNGACWHFCVRYVEKASFEEERGSNKVDYRKVLDEPTFAKFSKLREIRKKAALEEGVSAFIILTDEEMAELAKQDEISEKSMLSIKGVGEKKVERFGKYFIAKKEKNEETGVPD